jgi:AcrR family transcriptional regulator
MPERLTREQSRRRTRTSILDAAEDAFASRGYRASSLDDIAVAAGFTKGAVYSNFSSKADLFLALLDRRAERERTQLTTAGPTPTADPAWSLATLDFLVDAVGDEPTRRALADRYAHARSQTAGQVSGGRPDPDWGTWEEVASVAMALGTGLIIQAIIDPEAVAGDLFGRTMGALLRPTGDAGEPRS